MSTFSHRTARPVTTAMLDALDNGMFDKDALIGDLLGFMSEQDVADFVRRNDYADFIQLDDDAYDGQPDEAQEWESFDPDC